MGYNIGLVLCENNKWYILGNVGTNDKYTHVIDKSNNDANYVLDLNKEEHDFKYNPETNTFTFSIKKITTITVQHQINPNEKINISAEIKGTDAYRFYILYMIQKNGNTIGTNI